MVNKDVAIIIIIIIIIIITSRVRSLVAMNQTLGRQVGQEMITPR